MPRQLVIVLAERDGMPIAGALCLRGGDTLYGRYWGAVAQVSCLHFEACYYQPLAWCIAQDYRRFEGGAQGEHKMARGLQPVATRSAHWLAHPQFSRAVEDYLERESAALAEHQNSLQERLPFKEVQ